MILPSQKVNPHLPLTSSQANVKTGFIPYPRHSWSSTDIINSILRITDASERNALYDITVEKLPSYNRPLFYEGFSAMLVEAEESFASFAADYKSRLDSLTTGHYVAMKVAPEAFKVKVQYHRIEELQTRYNQILKKKKMHRARLERLWGPAWEKKLEGLLL